MFHPRELHVDVNGVRSEELVLNTNLAEQLSFHNLMSTFELFVDAYMVVQVLP